MLKGRLPLLLAAVFAVLAAMVAYMAIEQKGREISAGWEPVKVIMAKRDLAPGATLSKQNLAIGDIPGKLVTASVITAKMYKQNLADPFGQKLAIEIHAGDVLTFQHIATKTGGQHMAEAIQVQGRAVSVRVSAESAVNQWVEPSDRVDVIGIFRDPQTREMVAVTMLQNLIVLATGRIGGQTNRNLLTEEDRAYSTVTLHVLPEAVEMLVLAQDLGTLYLSLRNPEDNEIRDLLGEGRTTMTTLLTGERSKRLSTKQNKIFRVEIIRGTQTEQQVVH